MRGYVWVCTHGTLVMNAEETKWNKEGRYKVPEVGGDEVVLNHVSKAGLHMRAYSRLKLDTTLKQSF